jgi:acetyl esterase/lipase
MPVLSRVDPDYRSILENGPILDLSNVAAARETLNAIYLLMPQLPPNPAVERSDHMVPGLNGAPDVLLRLFRPRDTAGPVPLLYWIQGGGYVLDAPDLDDQLCDQIAADVQCAVISVLYRRAPEAPFPAASDDCMAGLRWAHAQSGLGYDASRIVIAGASAGGGAAAGLALRVRDEWGIKILHQLLIYPMLDDRNETASSHRITDPELWNRDSNERAWKAYLGSAYGSDEVSPYAAPARAKDLAGLPSTTILTGELDLFADEDILYAQRLMHAGIEVELHLYPAVHHGFDRHNPEGRMAKRFLADRNAVLARAFGQTE